MMLLTNRSNSPRRKNWLITFIFVLFVLSDCFVHAQIEYFPDQQWERRDAKSVGLNKKELDKAVSFAKSNEYSGARDLRIAILKSFAREPYHEIVGPVKERGGPAGLIIKDGYIIAEWGNTKRVDMTFSVTKSYLSTVAGLANDKGLIKVNDTVASYVWDGTFGGTHNSKITWDHLLTQSSDWSGDLFGMQDWADRPPREGDIDDWKNRTLLEPGINFEYNDVRVNLLAYSLLQVWRKPLPSILKERIMDPIGASTTWRWYGYNNSWVNVDGINVQSVSGGGHSGGGVFINTEDQARFGLLFLRNGMWKDKQLISKDWVEQVQNPSTANESYGYMWWLNKGNRKMEGISESVYYAAGFGGNYIVIDQANQLIVVTRWLEPSKLGELMKLVIAAL